VGVVPAGADVFGPDVVSHYATMARVELDAYHSAVTDWSCSPTSSAYDSHRAHHLRRARTMLVWQRDFAMRTRATSRRRNGGRHRRPAAPQAAEAERAATEGIA